MPISVNSGTHNFSIVNLTYINSICQNDNGFKVKLLSQFVRQMPNDMKSLKQAFEEGYLKALRTAVLHIKTTIHFLGFYESIEDSFEALLVQEEATVDYASLQPHLTKVLNVCGEAVEEVDDYLQTF